MSVTDQQILSEIQYATLEPTIDGGITWTSGMWTAAEVLRYLNQRQDRFLKESQILVSFELLPVAAQSLDLPPDWAATVRTSWKAAGGSTFVNLPLSDTWQADNAIPMWRTVTTINPKIAMESEQETLQLVLAPAPTGTGTISIYYISTGDPLDGTGNIFTVPDEFVPYIKWGAIADMFSKPGKTQDPERAAYCESRYEEGITLAKSWIEGYF